MIGRRLYLNADRMWGPEAQATKSSYVAEMKTAKQLLILIVGFVCAWTPYAVMSMSILLFNASIPAGIQEVPSMFAKTAVICNPIMYFYIYRELWKKALRTLKCTNRVSDLAITGTA